LKKIVFFLEEQWAFGSIHHELVKRLYTRGINGFMLHWALFYSREEMQELDGHVDLWITNPYGAREALLIYGIPPSRIGIVCYAQSEVFELNLLLQQGLQFRFHGFISSNLQEFSKDKLLTEGLLLPVRISVQNYKTDHSRTLTKIGFAGSLRRHPSGLKRFELVEEACKVANIELVVAERYHHSWITNASFYSQVDAIVQASTNEGTGLPQLEAGAAGRLVLTTNVGVYEELVTEKGADVLPMEPEALVATLVDKIGFYRENQDLFSERTRQIADHAMSYDWEHVLHFWENAIKSQ
jgi:glycosyltransferase involved in cell wall biosynthesis